MSFVLVLAMLCLCPNAWSSTTRDEQSIIAKWTGENICAMGVDRFYSISETEMRTLFESQTGMLYNDIPIEPTESERLRITSQLTAYIASVCPSELENYRRR